MEQLKCAINEKFGMPIVCQRLIRPTAHGGIILGNDAAQLRRDCGVWFGDEVTVELIGEGEGAGGPSACKAALDAQRSSITVSFNDVAAPSVFDRVVVASKLDTLGALKAAIAGVLACDAGVIHLRRNERAPQLKDESVTLGSLDLVDGSVVFVGAGAPMRPNEVLIKVRAVRARARVCVCECVCVCVCVCVFGTMPRSRRTPTRRAPRAAAPPPRSSWSTTRARRRARSCTASPSPSPLTHA